MSKFLQNFLWFSSAIAMNGWWVESKGWQYHSDSMLDIAGGGRDNICVPDGKHYRGFKFYDTYVTAPGQTPNTHKYFN